jgi:hypothetical protein
LNFTPAPPNTFMQFMHEYHARCKARVPHIRAVAAKWAFEDLIPGLSDFDTRFIVDDAITQADWRAMSLAVGEVHTEMCRAFPDWARNLEHLPGVNLTVSEMVDPRLFYPEFSQWTFYEGDAKTISHIERGLAQIPWSSRDELHHLKKFAMFFGPYIRGIDPAVNLGAWESKYPLHSRYMHYFAPPVQSAVSLMLRRNVRGKFEGLRLARSMFPMPETIDRIFAAVDRHFEQPEDYVDPRQAELERELERYLDNVWAALADHVTLVRPEPGDNVEKVRRKVAAAPSEPMQAFFESAKFGRLLEGRLRFYAESIPHFDSAWLIRNEVGRIGPNFYAKPLKIYGRVKFGTELTPEAVLDRLQSDLLSPAQCAGMRRFHAMAAEPITEGHERSRAILVADAYAVVPDVLEKLSDELLADACSISNQNQ